MAVFDDLQVLIGKKKLPQSSSDQTKKLLIVEDEPILLEMYKDKFTKEGFNVFTAENGKSGLELASAHKPNIILLDLMMPVMDGKTMLRRLREIPEFKSVPVIVLTNAGDIENIKETQNFGDACDFLIKSNVTVDEIVKKVKFWL